MPLTDVPVRDGVDETQLYHPSDDQKLPTYKKPIIAVICAAMALVVVFLACLKPGSADGYLFRMMTGQLISQQGIPHSDPFTWTASGQPWYIDGWLACWLFYFLNSHLPSLVLVLYKGGVGALIAGLVLWRAYGRSRSWPLSIFAAVLAGLALSDWSEVNQQMITYVFLAGLLVGLDRYRPGSAKKLPFILPVVFALWANLQSGAVAGLGLILLWIVGESVVRGESPLRARPLLLGLAVSAIAVALTPNGFGIYAYEWRLLTGDLALLNAADRQTHTWLYFQILLIGTPVAMAFAGIRRGWSVGDASLLIGMTGAALLIKRNAAPFAVAAAPIMAGAVAAGLRRIRLLDHAGMKQLGAVCGFAALIVLAFLRVPRIDKGNLFQYTFKTSNFPLAGCKYLTANADKSSGLLFNDSDWGGYLIWKFWPRKQIFVDPRQDFFMGLGAYSDAKLIESAGPGWRQALDRLGIQVVLTHKKGALSKALLLNHGWRMSFYGPVEGIFTRMPPA